MVKFAIPDTTSPGAQPRPASAPLTVGEVVSRIRGLIERQFPSPIWVEGELSNCTYHQSGHIYFNLKDEHATDRWGQPIILPCAFFRNANKHVKFKLVDGLKALCCGQVTTYEARSQYQLQVLQVEPKGMGALQLAFEQLKQRLAAEGLFEESRKRPLPRWPARIGLVTSPSGSVVHDMVSKLRGWFHVVIVPVKVQGEGAAREIAGAVELANRLHLADVLIVGRGGGSVEDLWAFNEEAVARAIAASRIPVISAVGHQDDWTIADYVADLRASTPTDAAKRLVYEQEAFATQSRDAVERLVESMREFLSEQDTRWQQLTQQLRLLHPLNQLERYLARTQELQVQCMHATRHALQQAEQRLQGLAGRLSALSPLAVLARGYSITFGLPGGAVVTDARAVRRGQELETRLAQGTIRSTITDVDRAEGT